MKRWGIVAGLTCMACGGASAPPAPRPSNVQDGSTASSEDASSYHEDVQSDRRSCTAPVAGEQQLVVPRSGYVPTTRCDISGEADVRNQEALQVWTSPEGGDLIAEVVVPSRFAMGWDDFRSGSRRARVALRSDTIELVGYADYTLVVFELGEEVWVHPEHLLALPECVVHPQSFDGENLQVELETPFIEPTRLKTRLRCDQLVHGHSPTKAPLRSASAPPEGELRLFRERRVEFFDRPHGSLLFTIEHQFATANDGGRLLAAQAGFARVHVSYGRVAVDAWVHDEAIYAPEQLASGYRPVAPQQVAVPSIVEGDTWVVTRPVIATVGRTPGQAELGVVRSGTVVVVHDRRDGQAAISFHSEVVRPPAGKALWVAADALEQCEVPPDSQRR